MCNCENLSLPTGPAGAAGAAGPQGLYGGWARQWKWGSSTLNSTGPQEVRFNHGTLSSVTKIYVNDTDNDIVDSSNFLASVASSPYGKIKVTLEADSSVFWLGTVTAADNTTVSSEYAFTVTHVLSNGTFTDTSKCIVTLMPSGPAGVQGPTGTSGSVIIEEIVADVPVTASSYAGGNVFTKNLAAGSLDEDGDVLRFEGLVLNTIADDSLIGINATFAASDIELGLLTSFFDYPNAELQGVAGYKLKVDLIRVSNTTVKVEVELEVLTDVGIGSYATNSIVGVTTSTPSMFVRRASQSIGSLTLDSTAYDFKVNLQTDDVAKPTKLVEGKLMLLDRE